MGSFLDKPETSKSTHVGQGNMGAHTIRYGVSGMQGWRLEMEDAHVAVTGLKDKNVGLFAIFDGHAGNKVARYSAANLAKVFVMQEGFDKGADGDVNALGEALGETFLDMDLELLEIESFKMGKDHSGATALAVAVTPTHLVFANAGDSRAILVGGPRKEVIFQTLDHKPDDPSELDRICNAGATVFEHRVNGDLAVSRGVGDFAYKRVAHLPPEEQPITAKPDVTIVPRNLETDQFLLLACDGIWDVMQSDAAGEFIMEKMNQGYGIGKICELILDHCLELSSHDNMSVVLVVFPAAPKQIGTRRDPAPLPRQTSETATEQSDN